jgi:S1-C subfamily serine protease
MKRKALYSRSQKPRARLPEDGGVDGAFDDPFAEDRPLGAEMWAAVRRFIGRHQNSMTALAAIVIVMALFAGYQLLYPQPEPFSQWDIDNAVKYALEHTPPGAAETAVAAATIAPSVVRVDGYLSPEHAAQLAKMEKDGEAKDRSLHHLPLPKPDKPDKDKQGAPGDKPDEAKADPGPDSTGSGVVIDEKGDIMTNLHVINSTDRWVVTFADGSKSDASVVTVQPENDLAVIRAKHAPDELKPATLASTADLHPGDTVTAVGFPFGIGPSVSSGVVSGLKREFADDDQKKKGAKLTNLIQFDAAVNPGNSGGPLVNRDGEVVGIVTAIYNPTGQRVFAGMGFAVPIENAAKAVGDNPL